MRAAHELIAARRLPRGAGRRRRRAGRRGDRHRLPPLPVQGRPASPRSSGARPSARSTPRARPPRRPAARRRARIAAAVETFARRALRGRRLAWALLAEPVDPAVEAERLAFRRAYAATSPRSLRDGIAAGELPAQNVDARRGRARRRARRGARRPAVPGRRRDVDADALVADLVAFCLRSVTDRSHADAHRATRPRPTRSSTRRRRWTAATSSTRPRRAARGAGPRGRRLGARAPARRGRLLGRRAACVGLRGQRAPARPAHPRPLRPPPRRGRVPPRLARSSCAPGSSDELHALPWRTTAPGAHVARAAIYICSAQAEAGFGCPITMTFAAVPALRAQPELADEWVPRLTARPTTPSYAADKPSALCGMAMTEKQGGSDVRANTTTRRRARPATAGTRSPATSGSAARRCATCSSCWPRPTEGLSCFALPRVLPDGTRNAGFQLQRLKDKLGNRSNASSEVEFRGALARMVGEPGRGVPTIIEMVNHTRLDCVIGAAGGMRAAVAQATWHAAHRAAFGAPPRRPAADGATCSPTSRSSPRPRPRSRMRLARAYDEAAGDRTPRRSSAWPPRSPSTTSASARPGHASEALECLGGNGYVEASGMPRAVPRGAAGLDLGGLGQRHGARRPARAGARRPRRSTAFLAEVDAGRRRRHAPRRVRRRPRAEFADPEDARDRARRVVERMALCLQASLLVRHAPPAVADAFCAARLAGDAA